ncbi:MFS transporter [Bradyrhizobium canariense]|uniref:MFS transporter n=1 Tax=Bradyrhizobium canariense TaxID=255045 RepID=UPI000A191106|nr:MFS transporter [Bradyrhizobium canariense]OSI33013.1 MFS transporter [Bradyrhizobium canariense]OSI36955.1 MFS transporter [Bradyrhizobium canariense]OSI55797.1 MFS transporter [Bradyrhizobium canariense]OSI57789.1 MFS transporter [Bradyrhizobium canariense]OSI59079.1 MFS transporter [Bradyrhizobium canariense]
MTSSPAARTKVVIAALTIAAFAIGLDTFVIIGALDVISRDLAISTGAAGWIISIYALCYAVFAPLNAWMFKSISRRNIQILSVSIFVIGNLICAIAPNFLTLAAGRVISAYGAAMFTPAATALAAELLPRARKGFALSLIFGGMTVSQVAGVPATSWIADAIGWRFSFGFVVIAGLLALIIFAPMMSGIPAKAPERGNGPSSKALSKTIYGILSVTLFIVVSEFIVYSYVSVFISGSLLAAVPLLSAALFAYGFGAVTGNAACGVLTDRFGPYKVLIAAVGAQLILLIGLVAFGQHGAFTVLIAFLWGNVSYMYLVPIQHRLLGLAGDRSKLVLAMNSSTTFAGIAIGAFLGGILVEISGVTLLAAASILIGVIGIGLAVAFMRDAAPAEAAPAASSCRHRVNG